MIKKIIALLMCAFMVFSFASCGDDEEKTEAPAVVEDGSRTDDEIGFQLEKAEKGEEIAVLTIKGFGDIRIRLFPKSAPKTVENFKKHIESGYYEGVIFHRIINNFMIQGGDPEGTGMGGESAWGGSFEDEFNENLLNLRGSLSMANSGPDTNGSQFFINQNKEVNFTKESLGNYYNQYMGAKEQFQAQYEEAYPDEWEMYFYQQYGSVLDPDKITDEVWDIYNKVGGNISLDGAYTESGRGHSVFGQVFEEDMKIVDKIAAVETDDSDKPLKDVIIESAKIVEYDGK